MLERVPPVPGWVLRLTGTLNAGAFLYAYPPALWQTLTEPGIAATANAAIAVVNLYFALVAGAVLAGRGRPGHPAPVRSPPSRPRTPKI